MPYATQTPEQRRASNEKGYAKRLGITVEQLEARRQAAREWKERNKHRRTKHGYVSDSSGKLKTGPKPGSKIKRDLWWERLKKKHAKWEGTRLEKSTNKPIFLTHSMAEREALKAGE